MMYLLDTDTFTLAHRDTKGLRNRIAVERKSQDVALPIVTRIEVLRGRFDSVLKAADAGALAHAQERLQSSEAYLSEFPIVLFHDAAFQEFERLRQEKLARKIGLADLLIACIALAHDAVLVTRNTKDFANVPNLKVENWAD